MEHPTRQRPFIEAKVIQGMRFLHEQDGLPERELKRAISSVLKGMVERAYLVRLEYADNRGAAVALCLCSCGLRDPVVKAVGAIFSRMFGPVEHLDIIFLDEGQERQLTRVSNPFFVGSA